MRAHGLVTELPAAGTSDHVCWIYDGDEAFDRAFREVVAGGLERGERLLCVGDGVIERLRGAGMDELLDSGAVETLTFAQAYEVEPAFLPEDQLAYYDAAVQRAVDDGYRGLRIIADVSRLAADPDRRADLVGWEHVADEFIARSDELSAMCAYRADLPAEVLAEATTAHPAVCAPEVAESFRLFLHDGRLELAGSVDSFSACRLAAVLAAVPVGPAGVVLDVRLLEFVDVAASRTLARWVRDARTGPVTVCGASPLFRRIWQLLGLGDIAPAAVSGSPA